MNTHKNARLTYARRLEMVRSVTERGATLRVAAVNHGVSVPTARKWTDRYLAQGATGLLDRTSRPRRSPRATSPELSQLIVQLRKAGFSMLVIARQVRRSVSTVSRICSPAGLSRISQAGPRVSLIRLPDDHRESSALLSAE